MNKCLYTARQVLFKSPEALRSHNGLERRYFHPILSQSFTVASKLKAFAPTVKI